MFSLPLNPESARQEMVAQQLRQRGILDPRVLRALRAIPRERFVAEPLHKHAYEDRALPIECGQTISQPYIVGLMSQALQLSGQEDVLEIGTGSGYQTAILSQLAARVTSIERHEPLSRRAAHILRILGCENVQLEVGDGTQGCSANTPFDRIIVTAATQEVPPDLWEQLAEGGILVIPLGGPSQQELFEIRKINGRQQRAMLCKCRFVPLVDEESERDEE
ncbi:MAG: protein-L-isoaspartate(D-aspartate) O-methyltransferase [Pirellulales bacterium]|nr:protein-L-isoaspartate(D-aspartate) O-methyltransferase [Pirellulales bacterium]